MCHCGEFRAFPRSSAGIACCLPRCSWVRCCGIRTGSRLIQTQTGGTESLGTSKRSGEDLAAAHIEAVAINPEPATRHIRHVEILDEIALIHPGSKDAAVEVHGCAPASTRDLPRVHGPAIQVEGAGAVLAAHNDFVADVNHTSPAEDVGSSGAIAGVDKVKLISGTSPSSAALLEVFPSKMRRIQYYSKMAAVIVMAEDHENSFRSSERYWMASRMSVGRMCSAPARSASVRATLRMRSWARAEKFISSMACSR